MADRRPAARIERRGLEALSPAGCRIGGEVADQHFRLHGARQIRKTHRTSGNVSERHLASSCCPVWTALHKMRQALANAAGESLRGLRTGSSALSHAAEAAEIAR